MKTLLPLIAIAATATACGGPEVLNRDLRHIPGLKLGVTVQDPASISPPTEYVRLDYDRSTSDSPCYRVPSDTRLTVNGVDVPLTVRGDASLSFDGVSGCEKPWFSGVPSPLEEARVEYLLTDGDSRLRAVFQNLHVKRSIRMNGQEQAALHAGEAVEVDVEWLPGTDQLLEARYIDLARVGSNAGVYRIETSREVEGNHVRFTLPAMSAGQYRLSVYGTARAGVEACEGFTSCDATFSESSFVDVTVE
ncbi:hypothetical protein [Archangium sp.]|uniref:hypothetical protein n=1 Tax=Archangium sp. TaxID=1872627 RepID=UPI003899B428